MVADKVGLEINSTDNTSADFAALKVKLDDLQKQRDAIVIGVDDKDAQAKLDLIDTQMEILAKKSVNPKLGLSGDAAVQAKIISLDAQMDALGKKDEKPKVDTSGMSGAASLMPLLIASAVAIAPAFVAAGVAVGAFGLAAIGPLENAVKNGTGPLAASLKSLEGEYKQLSSAVQPQAIQDFTAAMTQAKAILPEFTGVAQAGGKAVGVLITDFGNWMTSPGTKGFLSFVEGNAAGDMHAIDQAVTGLASGVEGLVEALSPVAKVILPLVGDLGSFIGAFAKSNPVLVQFATGVTVAALAFVKFKSASALTGALFDVKAFQTAVTGLEGVTTAEKAATVAGAAMDAINPLGWVALAIGGAIALGDGLGHIGTASATVNENLNQLNQTAGSSLKAYQNLASGVQTAAALQVEAGAQINGASAVTTAGYIAQTAASKDLNSQLDAQAEKYGTSVAQVTQWASSAGIAATAWTSSGKSAQGAASALQQFVDKSGSTVTAMSALDTAAEGSAVALNAMNTAWNNLVGNFASEQQAILNARQAVQSFAQAVQQSGAGSLAAQQAFYAGVQSIGQMQQAMDKAHAPASQLYADTEKQIQALQQAGPLNAQETEALKLLQAQVLLVANSTQGMTVQQQSAAKSLQGQLLPQLQAMHAATPKVTSDVTDLTNAIINTGRNSQATHTDRAQLIADLEASGVSASTAKQLVQQYINSVLGIPKSAGTKVNANTAAALLAIQRVQQEMANINGSTATTYINTVDRGTVGGPVAVGGRATGGIVGAAVGGPRSGMLMVGEHGPELVSLPTGSTVHSNSDSSSMIGAGLGGGGVNISFEIGGSGNVDFDKFMLGWMRNNVRVKGGGNVQRTFGNGTS